MQKAASGRLVLLILSMALLGVVVFAGAWLARRYLLTDDPPDGLHWPGATHGAAGLAGLALLVAALLGGPPSAHAARMGAGAFGGMSGALIAGAALAGGAILLTHLRRKPVSMALVATHGLLGITGYTLLVTYFTMLS